MTDAATQATNAGSPAEDPALPGGSVPPEETSEAETVLSPSDVATREFSVARKGYDRVEVRSFLELMASALANAVERISELERLAARAAVSESDTESEAEFSNPANSEALLEAVAAEAWRDEVLSDLDRRRRELNGEVMRLRAGRDRLRQDLGQALSALGEQLQRLEDSLHAARSAGDLAEHRVRAEATRSTEERLAELEAARLAGFATIDAKSAATAEQSATDDAPQTWVPKSGAKSEVAESEIPRVTAVEPVAQGGEVSELFARLRAERPSSQSQSGA